MSSRVESPSRRSYVLLLNWRGWEDTVECLESVFRQTHGDFRVVVCDNDSGDGSLDQIRAWAEGKLLAGEPANPVVGARVRPPVPKPVRCVSYDRTQAEVGDGSGGDDSSLVLIQTGGNLGFAGGNNVGLRYVLARGDAGYVWLLNNDTVADEGALAALVRVAEADPALGMVGSKLLHYDRPDVIQAVAGGRVLRWTGTTRLLGRDEPDAGQWEAPIDPEYVTGASLLVRSETLRQVGLMDERYGLYSEEVDWCLRVRRAGWKLGYAAASRVWHKEGASVGDAGSPVRDYHSVRSMLLLTRKFHPYRLPFAFVYWLYRSLLPKLVRCQPARARAVLRGYRDFLAMKGF